MTSRLLAVAVIPLCFVAEDMWLKDAYPSLYATKGEYGFSKAYALMLLINVVACSLYTMISGFMVGYARRQCVEEAQEAGDKDAEERYLLPKMQAEGFSATARKFNNMQRCHYQILESFQIWLVTSIIGGWEYPLSVAFFGAIWIKARMDWATGYKARGPKERYSVGIAPWTWYAVFTPSMAIMAQCGKVLLK